MTFYRLPRHATHRAIPANAGFICGKAAVLGDTITWTHCNVLKLWNRKRPTSRYYVKTWPNIDMKHSHYNGRKQTAFLVHGFMSTGNDTWVEDMKNAYLNNVSVWIAILNIRVLYGWLFYGTWRRVICYIGNNVTKEYATSLSSTKIATEIKASLIPKRRCLLRYAASYFRRQLFT